VLEELIPFSPGHQEHICLDDLRDHRRVAILPIEPHQRHPWGKFEARQVGVDRLEGRGQFTTIVAVAPSGVGADPLPGMHLQHSGPGADDFPAFTPDVSRRTDRIESASGWR
jgi:hypothetical protein